MIRMLASASVALVFALGTAVAAQPGATPSTPPAGADPYANRAYSGSGSGLPDDASMSPNMKPSPNAAQSGRDSAAETPSPADAKMLNKCKAMTMDDRMKSRKCASLMKAHPDAASDDGSPNMTADPK